MKNIATIIFLILPFFGFAQKTETYYDYRWKPCEPLKARFYSTLEKTDSGWLRYDYFISGMKLQMKALFEDSACTIQNGQSVYAYANGKIQILGRQIHGKNEGICLRFYPNGMMADSANYHNNRPVGDRMKWWPNGFPSDSIAHVNDSMDVQISWFDNGNPSAAGYLLYGKMHGKWKFYHKTGAPASVEVYDNGKLMDAQYFNENGNLQTDTSKIKSVAIFKGGSEGWQKYLNKNLYWPNGYKFENGDMAVVMIMVTIAEDGKPEDVEISTPFHPAFDKIALDAVRRCPPWIAAMDHNRKVKQTFLQPVVFSQTE